MNDVAKHYDILIDENNDPVHVVFPLQIIGNCKTMFA